MMYIVRPVRPYCCAGPSVRLIEFVIASVMKIVLQSDSFFSPDTNTNVVV